MPRKSTFIVAPSPLDAYSPAQIAARVEHVGVTKALLPTGPTIALGALAGAFIALGAMLFTLVMTQAGDGFGLMQLLGGVAFSLGPILVVVGGAELFTGNNLIVMAWAHRKITTRALLRNWTLVYLANFMGALVLVALAFLSGHLALGDHAVGAHALTIALVKVNLPFWEAFFRGVLCNVLLCLAVWLCYAAHDVASKILAIMFPISAFAALGFEHSVANMYMIPIGILAAADPAIVAVAGAAPDALAGLSLAGFGRNLLPVTLGNIVGGGVLVALVYYIIYLRER
ncbi:MAG: formate transporter FocA [Candidatus Muproteobacteria bacterium RBG_16_65_31]|uniref:Formate transporter FocA n=1 Tax=Candidatus Muproteobacteria bacterium RBG_16_65_31 TaxID=1817759 RepID=A0A1F6TFY1_9PROT|nr:MAG: formate transporter FocA [Candidatus Muproteobacteria bacterium RBG_16_65_31]